MPGKGDDLSMFSTLEQHDLLIKEDILPRLEKVETMQAETKTEIQDVKTEVQGVKTEVTAVRNAQNSLELTVMKDGQHTRDLLNTFVNHYLKVDEQELERKEKITLRKLSKSEKVSIAFISMLGGGGIVAVAPIIIHFFDKLYP